MVVAALILYGSFSLETTPVDNSNNTRNVNTNVNTNYNVNANVNSDSNVNVNGNSNVHINVNANVDSNTNVNVDGKCSDDDKSLALKALKDKFLGFTLVNYGFDPCTQRSIVVTCKWKEKNPALPEKVKCEKIGSHWQCF
jgi:hypothetical protein